MSKGTATVAAVVRDAGLFPHQLDLIQRRVLFVRVVEDELRAASFLDERLDLRGRDALWLALDDLFDAAAETATAPVPAFIFHIGHCGSTLLSRLLDLSSGVLGLREPLVLRHLAAAEFDRDAAESRLDPQQWPALFALSLGLLGRGFRPDQQVVVKATSGCNNLIPVLMASRPEARSVLLHIPLETYLATMMKAPGGARDALQFAPARLRYLHRRLGDDGVRLYRLVLSEMLALGWVAELLRFKDILADAAVPGGALMLDFETLLGTPDAVLDRVGRHLRLSDERAQAAFAADRVSAVMDTYAKKPDHPYSPADREHDLALSRRRFGAEIARGMLWADRLIDHNPLLASLAPLTRRSPAPS